MTLVAPPKLALTFVSGKGTVVMKHEGGWRLVSPLFDHFRVHLALLILKLVELEGS